MSLKYFHILFVTVASLVMTLFGFWSINYYQTKGDTAYISFAIVSFLCVAGLIVYGLRFYQKIKTLD